MRPGDTFGGYRLTGELGAGGMGVVFTADDLRLGRPVALKVLPAELAEDPDYRRRFLREATTLAQLDSPHIVHMYDHGEVDGRLYLVTQLVTGGDLSGHLRTHGPLRPEQAVELTAQVASALADAHAAGVLHRDVKPSNILLRNSQDLFSYLCDFGIATRIDAADSTEAALTQVGVVAGTWAYLSPERSADNAPASVASDIYSVGCVLWAMLSGQAPYQGSSAVQVALHHVRTPVPQLETSHPWAARLNPVLATAMAKEPAARYGAAADLRTALLEVLHGRVPTARSAPPAPPTPPPPPDGVTLLKAPREASPPPAETDHTILKPPAEIPRPAAPPAPRNRRTPAVVAALVVLAVLAGAGAVVALTRGGDPAPTVTPRPEASSAVPTASSPAPTVASATAAGRIITCWDGRTTSARSECGRPQGPQGLEWVFPSFASTSPACVNAKLTDAAIDRPQQWECKLSVRGVDVLVRYSELSDTTTGRTSYEKQYAAGTRQTVVGADGRPARYVWRLSSPDDRGVYKLSSMYVDYPYSVSIESTDQQARDDVLAVGLVFREPRDLLGSG